MNDWVLAGNLETVSSRLEDTGNLLELLYEHLEGEGDAEAEAEWVGLSLVNRMPMFLSLLSAAHRLLAAQIEAVNGAANAIYAAERGARDNA